MKVKTAFTGRVVLFAMAAFGWSATIVSAKGIDFDFKDPKSVNTIAFVLDSMFEPFMGLATGITGTVTFDPAKPEDMKGKIVVAAKSLQFGNSGMTSSLQGEDMLNVKKNPDISFELKKVEKVEKKPDNSMEMQVAGEFTCKGVTKPMTLPVKVSFHKGKAGDRMKNAKGDLLVLRSTFTIKRSVFGIGSDGSKDIVADDIEVRVSIVGSALEK